MIVFEVLILRYTLNYILKAKNQTIEPQQSTVEIFYDNIGRRETEKYHKFYFEGHWSSFIFITKIDLMNISSSR